MISGLEKITKDEHGFGEKRIISGLEKKEENDRI